MSERKPIISLHAGDSGTSAFRVKFYPDRISGISAVPLVSEKTRAAEASDYASVSTYRRMRGGWVRLAKNRILFRHDDRRGEISATLPHAIY